VAADGRAERARGARDLRARRAPPLGQRVLAVVGARHPQPPARHREAEPAEILHHGPPPAYARGQAAVGGVGKVWVRKILGSKGFESLKGFERLKVLKV
jgi:hypothetical protein